MKIYCIVRCFFSLPRCKLFLKVMGNSLFTYINSGLDSFSGPSLPLFILHIREEHQQIILWHFPGYRKYLRHTLTYQNSWGQNQTKPKQKNKALADLNILPASSHKFQPIRQLQSIAGLFQSQSTLTSREEACLIIRELKSTQANSFYPMMLGSTHSCLMEAQNKTGGSSHPGKSKNLSYSENKLKFIIEINIQNI